MSYDLKFSRIINAPKADVFNYFTNSALLESWSYPEGMTLKVPYFENNLNGKYRFEHSDKEGRVYTCTGYIKKYQTNKLLTMIDEVTGPDGNMMFKDLESEVLFIDDDNRCLIEVTQSGFEKRKDAQDCRQGWEESLDRLNSLFQQFEESII